MLRRTCLAALLCAASPALAQPSVGQEEVVVTARRGSSDDYDEHVPAVGLRRVADFAVQDVIITCDTRDPDKRHDEIFAMIRGAILQAQRDGVDLATGTMVVEPLTLANFQSLTLTNDGRPDSDKTEFLVKTRLTSSVDAKSALEKIDHFIKAVPNVGRAEMKARNDLTLSVIAPDQYRGQIIDLVAADARATALKVGPDYGVEIKGVDRPVEWTRASLAEVFLYLPYSYVVAPRGH